MSKSETFKQYGGSVKSVGIDIAKIGENLEKFTFTITKTDRGEILGGASGAYKLIEKLEKLKGHLENQIKSLRSLI